MDKKIYGEYKKIMKPETKNPLEEKSDIDKQDEETIEYFDFESALLEGSSDIVDRTIDIFNKEKGEMLPQKIRVRALGVGEWGKAQKKLRKLRREKSEKTFEELICEKGWIDPQGMPVPASKISKLPYGVVSQVYEEIKTVSGYVGPEDKAMKEAMENF